MKNKYPLSKRLIFYLFANFNQHSYNRFKTKDFYNLYFCKLI